VTILSLGAVSVHAGSRALVEAVTLELGRGDFLALLGPNGAGKTTLLRAALGLRQVSAGTVTLGGHPVASLSARARAAELAWLPQQAPPAEPIPVRDAVLAARYRFNETAVAARRGAEAALERVGLLDRAGAALNELSGGERQRVAIAALLAQEARLLLLDEPANHLDPAQQADTYALLGRLRESGVGIWCVTHDVNLLAHVAGTAKVVGIARGKLRFSLDYRAPELPERLSELFGVTMLGIPVGSARLIVPAPPGQGGAMPPDGAVRSGPRGGPS
jgi:iron complex transport system ATP-binding protein